MNVNGFGGTSGMGGYAGGSSRDNFSPTVRQLSGEGGLSFTNRSFATATQYRFLKRNVPTVEMTFPTHLNAMKIQDVDAELARNRDVNPVTEHTLLGSRFLQEQQARWGDLRSLLVALESSSSILRDPASYNTRNVTLKNSGVLGATAGKNAIPGEYNVNVTAIAASHQLASNAVTNPSAALGLSGTIRVNGRVITIEEGDALSSIRDKINRGEDLNFNGKLDPAEDQNGNGRIDVTSIPSVFDGQNYLPSFYYNEDSDGDGQLSSAEDTNNNGRLDFSSEQTRVKAVINNGQLFLASTESANIEIRLRDPNGVLESIGILVRNSQTGQLAEDILNPGHVKGQNATFTINGTSFSLPQNEVSGVNDGLSLTLRHIGDETIKLEKDTAKAVQPLISFSMTYNDAIRLINLAIKSDGALGKNIRLQTIYSDTVRDFYLAPPEPFGDFASVRDIGVGASDKEPTAIGQAEFVQLKAQQDDGLSLPGRGVVSLYSISDKVGVNSEENFTIRLDGDKFKGSYEKDSASVEQLLNFAAGRLQQRLEEHLNPQYGTIKLQENNVEYHLANRGVAQKSLQQATAPVSTEIAAGSNRSLFKVIA